MKNGRIFTHQQLREMETPLADQVAAAIDGGRLEEAKVLARQMEQEFVPMVHIFEDFVTALLSWVGRQQGEDALRDSLRYAAEKVMQPMHDDLTACDFATLVKVYAGFFRAHTGRGLRIEEDEEKVTLVLDPCGSGGRMVKAGYFAPPKDLFQVADGTDFTFGRRNFPSYCTHCAIFHHIMPIEWSGKPFPPIEVGEGPGDPCRWHLYKNTDKIPDRYYEQVGKKRSLL
ncbi:MAG: hypothetical protein IH614_12565 [Desulfuromonadales bacterium]|nr:hypothetical protein [Desulfuromonadales bacterium]